MNTIPGYVIDITRPDCLSLGEFEGRGAIQEKLEKMIYI